MESTPGGMEGDSNVTAAGFMASCEKLDGLIECYREAAAGPYQDNPEALSAMHLTTMELWAAVDISATRLVPLLHKYSPGIPAGLFDGLVLPRPGQLERLARVEDHLARRRAAAGSNGPPWQHRSDDGSWSSTCFAVRYYEESCQHRQLHQDIIHAAQDQLAEDRAKAAAKAEVARLAREKAQDMTARGFVKALRHVRAARGKDAAAKDDDVAEAVKAAEAAEVAVHQMWSTLFLWPLPQNETAAKAFVFEIQAPAVVTIWREATLNILERFWPMDAKRNHDPELSERWALCGDHPIIKRLVRPSGGRQRRFQLALRPAPRVYTQCQYLQTDSKLEEPYRVEFMSERWTFYNTSLQPRDNTLAVWECLSKLESKQQRYPPTTIPPILQMFTLRTAHTSNQVLAAQPQCPEKMTVDEFRAFGSLRAGRRLQWHNMLLQLAMPSIDLNRPEAFFLVMQAANETGPRGEGNGALRSTHAILSEQRFGNALLRALEDTLGRAERRGESEVLLGTLVSLAVKLLSVSPHKAVQERCLTYLRHLRHQTARQTRRLAEQLRSCGEADAIRRDRLKEQVYMMALVCHNTFDVGTMHAPSLLSDSYDSALLIEASVRAAEHTPPARNPHSPTTSILGIFSHRWHRLSYEMEPQLKHLIVGQGSPCLDMAAGMVWASYEGGGTWSAAPVPRDHVLTRHLVTTAAADTLLLQYNLLTGSLLVNGSPFSTLPASFREHITYRRLFGTYDFTVIPSRRKSQGMQYQATSMYRDHEIHFAMFDNGNRLVVQSEKDGTIYELIPRESLIGDFPSTLIEDCVHWFVPAQGRIEFRPIKMAWTTLGDAGPSAGRYYTVDLSCGTGAARLSRHGSSVSVVDIRSETATMMQTMFLPLELPRFIDMAYDKSQSTMSIILPRLGLAFSLASGTATIVSEQYKGYEVDPDQALGTLSGLESKLIVRRPVDDATGQLAARLVLIPVGKVSFRANPTTTTISTSTSGRVQHHAFSVDTMLGCLRDDGAVGAKLLLCHLHAATTYCLPDRLTGRTGTDEALRILRSSAVQSANQLQEEDIDRLRQISAFSPTWSMDGRDRVVLKWDDTTPWAAQDSALGELAKAVLDKSGSAPSSDLIRSTPQSLMRRRAARTSTYLVSQYGVLEQQQQQQQQLAAKPYVEDAEYSNLPTTRDLELQVCRLTRHLAGGEKQATLLHPVHRHNQFLATCKTILEPCRPSPLRARFHAGWIQKRSEEVSVENWCEVLQEVNAMRQEERPENHIYELIFFLAGLMFAPDADLELVQILLAVATEPIMQTSQVVGPWPPWPRSGTAMLLDLAAAAKRDLAAERERHLAAKRLRHLAGERNRRFDGQRERGFVDEYRLRREMARCKRELNSYSGYLNFGASNRNYGSDNEYVDKRQREMATRHIRACFTALVTYFSKLPISQVGPEPYPVSRTFIEEPRGASGFVCLQDMFNQPAPATLHLLPETSFPCEHPGPRVPGRGVSPALASLLEDLEIIAPGGPGEHQQSHVLEDPANIAPGRYEQDYVQELRQGLAVLDGRAGAVSPGGESFQLPTPPPPPPSRQDDGDLRLRLLEHLAACRRSTADMFAVICGALGGTAAPPTGSDTRHGAPRERHGQLLQMPSLAVRLPPITPVMLLERLSRSHRTKLSREWLRCLCDYAVSLTVLQRAERMVRAVDDDEVLARELQNVGHENWDPIEFPDWLLLEVEMGILIRPVQKLVASAMMNPLDGQNHVMQLNAGQGKSSVVIPMVAAALADGSRLVRVMVAKPQSKQMLHMLRRAFGGLLGRHIHTMPPFSRGVIKDLCGYQNLADLYTKLAACQRDGDVLIAQPEHVLSLRLLGLEAALPGTTRSNRSDQNWKDDLLRLQYFLDGNSRDLIDESDEVLSTKSELAYTMGAQAPIDLGQLRWRMIQSILGMAADIAAEIGQEHSHHLEIIPAQIGRFPSLRILDEDGADILTKKLVHRILAGSLTGFTNIASRQQPVKEAVLRYITHLQPKADDVALVEASFTTEELQGQLLLLRGLVAHRVLCFALQKRWRVDYGRADGRDPPTGLAVPFRAKDSPTPRSDFCHPDLVIVLTCLTYYYGGLRDDELFRLMERLLLSVDGERIYQGWVQSAPNKIPPAARQPVAINIKDRKHCVAAIFPHLCYLRAAIDYYLSNIVFAREMREFPQKLSESAWSLAAARAHPVTGFSGTKDTKHLLPATIKFLDLDEQRHTNALVLNYLLGPENTVQCMTAPERWTPSGDAVSPALQLIRHVVNSAQLISVIIDAGAQIVELDNAETARQWLDMVPAADASAAVFFDSDDDICVLLRDGTVASFWTSSYATNMASCLVYLDEAHTRGTDLRLPRNYRAAVTLGPGLTKDRLIQACMRMRELGHGQSVALVAPVEIQRRIVRRRGKHRYGDITVADVLAWSITETWDEARRLGPLWKVQGRRQAHQRRLWQQADKEDHYELSSETADQFLEPGSLTLREHYHPQCKGRIETVEGEQERELLAEVEICSKVSLPRAKARQPSLHPDVETFVETGWIPDGSAAFLPAFESLLGSSVTHLLRSLRPSGLRFFVTADFACAVNLPSDAESQAFDAYQRPVQWVCTAAFETTWSGDGDAMMVAVVLSPWEADHLMPRFRAGKIPTILHLFAPRTCLDMRSADDLLLYALPAPPPRWRAPRALMLTLLLFAGQLYLRTYDDYVAMCQLLGVRHRADAKEEQEENDEDVGTFGSDAVPFFLELFERIRHPLADISNTDIGCILNGKVLPRKAFSAPVRSQ